MHLSAFVYLNRQKLTMIVVPISGAPVEVLKHALWLVCCRFLTRRSGTVGYLLEGPLNLAENYFATRECLVNDNNSFCFSLFSA